MNWATVLESGGQRVPDEGKEAAENGGPGSPLRAEKALENGELTPPRREEKASENGGPRLPRSGEATRDWAAGSPRTLGEWGPDSEHSPERAPTAGMAASPQSGAERALAPLAQPPGERLENWLELPPMHGHPQSPTVTYRHPQIPTGTVTHGHP